ncbi:uncharacterized protein BDV17DRAFT_203703 [Aspergillus undulatus]|uniref:uncharacterized protein n=1 Tax=Aspergillus undulatus TaxID=1810928 RepID=UPI003CCD9145
MEQPYTVTVKNKTTDRLSYCVVAQPPFIDDLNNNLVKSPVLQVVGPIAKAGQKKFDFIQEYYAFVGQEKLDSNGKATIELEFPIQVNIATSRDSGSYIDAFFENDQTTANAKPVFMARTDEQKGLNVLKLGTFEIHCGDFTPPNSKEKYVVGLAMPMAGEKDTVMPIAALPFIEGKSYVIAPSNIMCIRSNNAGLYSGCVVDTWEEEYVPIQFPPSTRRVAITQDERGVYSMDGAGHSIRKNSLYGLRKGQSQSHSFPTAHHEAPKSKTPRTPAKWEKEAEELGLETPRQAYNFLAKYNQHHLGGYHKTERLKQVARNADEWAAKIEELDWLNDEFMDHLLVLALFDCILFLDNSESINWHRNRSEERQLFSETIVAVEEAYEHTGAVRVHLLNGSLDKSTVETKQQMTDLLDTIENYGNTQLGTKLEAKVLQPFVYEKLGKNDSFCPILITIITDGSPQGEPTGTFKAKLQECERRLKERRKANSGCGDKHVVFQISRVGQDKGAIKFITDLRNDKDLKGILHCTSCTLSA